MSTTLPLHAENPDESNAPITPIAPHKEGSDKETRAAESEIRQGEDLKCAALLLEEIQSQTSPEKAAEIMGEQLFFGPTKITQFWGINVPSVPDIPFSEATLRKAKELGMSLQYFPEMNPLSPYDLQEMADKQIRASKTQPLHIDGDNMFLTDAQKRLEEELKGKFKIHAGWRLVHSKITSQDKDNTFIKDLGGNNYRLSKASENPAEAYFRMINQQRLGLPITPALTNHHFEGRIEQLGHESLDEFSSFGQYRLGLFVTSGLMGLNVIQPGAYSQAKKSVQYNGTTINGPIRYGQAWSEAIIAMAN